MSAPRMFWFGQSFGERCKEFTLPVVGFHVVLAPEKE
jgi:hypothetical protein